MKKAELFSNDFFKMKNARILVRGNRLFVLSQKIVSVFLSLLLIFNIMHLVGVNVLADNVSETDSTPNLKNTDYSEYATDRVELKVGTEVSSTTLTVQVDIPVTAFYTFGMSYSTNENKTNDLKVSLAIDGTLPFENADALRFPRMWENGSEIRTDGLGNEFAPEQKPYSEIVENTAVDIEGFSGEEYLIKLEQGIHTVSVTPISGEFYLDKIFFGAPEKVYKYEKSEKIENYDGDNIVLEGENAILKNSYWLTALSDRTSAQVNPSDAMRGRLNYIGGSNWKKVGETITWKTPHISAGYYQLGFSYRQNTVIGSNSYRHLKIDGKTPFLEAKEIGFPYGNSWDTLTFADSEGIPYLIYLDEGVHEISLTVTQGAISETCSVLQDALNIIEELYLDMTMITGENVDIYRSYDLFNQIPEMENQLNDSLNLLNEAISLMEEITGKETSSYSSTVLSMVQIIEQMLENKSDAHRYKSNYYNNYSSLSTVLNDMRNMPLDIDRIILSSPDKEISYGNVGFFESCWFSIKRIVASFTLDYNNISGTDGADEEITLWVNWGRDQAQILNSLIQTSFTPESNISVNVKVVNATIIQGVLSGNGPDAILQHTRTEPINLAMRGVLYDLTNFEDCKDVLNRFQKGADIPYRYKNGLYALPDTQTFYLMYYRKDILDELGLKVPETWDEFFSVAKELSRNNLDVYIPYTQITDMTQVNTGVGSLSLFPSLLLQNGLSLYTEDQKSTTLTSQDVISVFNKWTSYYNEAKFPITMNFYNRFRVGTAPIGIELYTQYNTIKAAAVEIEGLWDIAPIPGTEMQDGTISHTSAGGGTGCAILEQSDKKDAAWEFLKWWTSAETQLSYSNNVEAVLGPTGRIAVSNKEAFVEQSWDEDKLEKLLSAWNEVEEIPEVPGSYYVSRAIDHSFWNVVNNKENPKDLLLIWGKETDDEILRKWEQYENR